MARISVQFAASGNFGNLLGEIEKVNARLLAMQANLKTAGALRPQGMAQIQQDFRKAVNSMQAFETHAMTVKSRTRQIFEEMERGKTTFGSMRRNWSEVNNLVNEQLRLANAVGVAWKRDASGNIMGDLIVPTQALGSAAERASMRTRILSQQAAIASDNMVKWGKNMQWSGRQLMVGFTLPLVAAGAAIGKFAYDFDHQMTRLMKVYGDLEGASEQAKNRLRADVEEISRTIAEEFGIAGDETAALAADLAAAGAEGPDLARQIKETARIMTLGEIDRQQAVTASIALQNTFKLNTIELAESFDYFNAIENETATSLQDLMDAIPRAAGPVAALGGNFKQLGVMMVAMKEAGVEASVGANGLRSAIGALVAPSDLAQRKVLELSGGMVDIRQIVASTGGDMWKTFEAMNTAFREANLSAAEMQGALAIIFGRYQFGRVGAMLQNIFRGMNEETKDLAPQTAEAMELMGASVKELRQVADRELAEQAESVSGRVKRLAATIKTQLAIAGQPILEVVADILTGVSKVIDAFNALPSIVKKSLAGMAILTAVTGLLIMLTGLAANFVGQILRVVTGIFKWRTRTTELHTAESRLASLLRSTVTPAVVSQGDAFARLSAEIQKATTGLERFASTQGAAAAAAGSGVLVGQRGGPGTAVGGVWQSASGGARTRGADGRSRTATQAEVRAARDAAHAQALREQSEGRSKRNWVGIGGGMLAAVGMLGTLLGGTDSWVGKLGMAALTLGIILPLVQGITRAGIAAAFAAMLTPVGLAVTAVAAIAAGVFAVWKNTRDSRKEFEELNNAASGMAEIMNVEMPKAGQFIDPETGAAMDGMLKKVDQFREKMGGAVKVMERMNSEGRRQEAIRIGMEIYNATGDAEKAREAAEIALRAVGELNIDVRLKGVNFEDDAWRMRQQADQLMNDVNRIANNKFDQGKWEGLSRFANAQTDNANQGAIERARKMGQDLAVAYGQGLDGGLARADVKKRFDEVDNAFVSQMQSMIRTAGISSEKLSAETRKAMEAMKLDPQNSEDIARFFLTLRRGTADYTTLNGASRELFTETHRLRGGYHELIDTVREETQVSAAATGNRYDLSAVSQILAGAQGGVAKTADRAAGAIDKTGDAAGGAAGSVDDLAGAMSGASVTAEQFIQALQGNVGNQVGNAVDYIGEQFDRVTDSMMDSVDADGDKWEDNHERKARVSEKYWEDEKRRSDDAFETRADNLEREHKRAVDLAEDAAKKQIDALQRQNDADEERDRARQRLFERERTRLQRMSEMANRSINFNIAFNEGNLDEAARVMEEGAAASLTYGMEDAERDAGDISEARRNERERQMTSIRETSQVYIESLREQYQAAKDNLQREKEIADERIRASQETAKARLEAEKETNRKALEDRKAKIAEERRITKAAMDAELAYLAASVPRTAEEYQDLLNQLAAKYQGHTGVVLQKNKEWTGMFLNGFKNAYDLTQRELANTARWTELGRNATEGLAQGMLGMSFEDFITWMRDGKLPTPTTATRGAANSTNPRSPVFAEQWGANHGGGFAGQSSGRAGRAMSSGLFNDEIPTILQKGEYVMDKDTVKRYGAETFKAMQKGKGQGMDDHGRMHRGGLVGVIGGSIMSGFEEAMAAAILAGADRKSRELAAAADYGNIPPQILGNMMGVDAAGGAPAMPPGNDGFAPWLTPLQRQVNPGVLARVWQGLAMVPGRQIITSGLRPGAIVAGTNRPSLHGRGLAVDIAANAFNPAESAMGDMIAKVFRTQIAGVSEVLWKTMQGGNHYDHVHVGFRNGAGMGIPGLRTGGYVNYDNTIANLHKNETVLTAPLSAKLERGIDKMDSGGHVEYNIHVHGANANADEIANKVMGKIQRMESIKGVRRVVT